MIGQLANHLPAGLARRGLALVPRRVCPPPVAVLAYHDLCEDRAAPTWLRVRQGVFSAQLQLLREVGHFLRPEELLQPEAHRPDRLNLLLTFDDGFVNHYRLALPVLERLQIPALFFLTTGALRHGRPFWFDQILCPIVKQQLTRLDLRFLGLGSYRFPPRDGAQRWAQIQRLLEDVKAQDPRGEELVRRLTGYLHRDFACPCAGENCPFRPLSDRQVLVMRDSGLCHFGTHGHQHAILTELSPNLLRFNLGHSRNLLEELLQCRVVQISYPNGNLNPEVMQACRQAGYEAGYVTGPGLVTAQSDRFALPRFLVSGYDSAAGLAGRLAWECLGPAVAARRLARATVKGAPC